MTAAVQPTADGHHVIVDGRRWRATDPSIPPALAAELRTELMSARRAVAAAQRSGRDDEQRAARQRVQHAKVALGERGREWWLPADAGASRARAAATVQALTQARPEGGTCPSEVARATRHDEWRSLLPMVREVAVELEAAGVVEITQRGQRVQPPFKGPIRLRRARGASGRGT